MKIVITQTPQEGFSLRLPTELLLNRGTAWMVARQLRKQGVEITGRNLYLFMKAVRAYKKEHPGWQLVEVTGAKGERVEVNL